MKPFMILGAALILSACTQSVDTIRVAGTVQVLDDPPPGAAVLGPVEAQACLNNPFSGRPGWDVALDELRANVAAMGGNAVTGVDYAEAAFSLCPSALNVTGTALRVE